jgi:hypothetical protein
MWFIGRQTGKRRQTVPVNQYQTLVFVIAETGLAMGQ